MWRLESLSSAQRLFFSVSCDYKELLTNYIILDDVDGYKARAEENIISFEIFNNILERKKKRSGKSIK